MNDKRREEFAREWARERRQRLIVRSIWLFVAVVCIYWYFGAGEVYLGYSDKPRFHWYSIRADFEVAGKPVSVGGVIECARKGPDLPPLNLGSGPGNPYDPSTEAFAAPLETGGVVIISPPPTCRYPKGSLEYDFPKGFYPTVYWIDDAEKPSRMEIYFSDAYYQQPDARVQFVGFEAERLSWGAFSWSTIFGNRQLERLYSIVPWFKKQEPLWFRGFYTVKAGPDDLAGVPGLLEELEDITSLTMIRKSDPLLAQEDRLIKLDKIFRPSEYRNARIWPRYGCRFADRKTLKVCEAFERTFGMVTHDDSFGASISRNMPYVGVSTLVPTRIPEGQRRDFRFEFFGSVAQGHLRSLREDFYIYDPRTKSMFELVTKRVGPGRLGIRVSPI